MGRAKFSSGRASQLVANSLTEPIEEKIYTVESCLEAIKEFYEDGDYVAHEINHNFDKLEKLYESSEEVIRYRIVYGLSMLPSPQSSTILERALSSDASSLVRHEAACGLGESEDESVAAALRDLGLRDESYLVRHESAMALASLGDVSALPALEEGLRDPNHEVVISCQMAIGSIRYRMLSRRSPGSARSGTRLAEAEVATDRFLKKASNPPHWVDDVSVVFIDMVAFSSLRGSTNMAMQVDDFQRILFAVLDPHYHWDEVKVKWPNKIIVIPTGDGYAIAFHQTVDRRDVLTRVDEIYVRLVRERGFEIRMGISRGPHIVFIDLNENLNIIGEGIIGAQRAMTLAGTNQILCTGDFAAGLEYEIHGGRLDEIDGRWRVKNERPFDLFNYSNTHGAKRIRIGSDPIRPEDRFLAP
jgi:class 3 adenylate cyclase